MYVEAGEGVPRGRAPARLTCVLFFFVKCPGGWLTWADWRAFLAVSYSPGALMGKGKRAGWGGTGVVYIYIYMNVISNERSVGMGGGGVILYGVVVFTSTGRVSRERDVDAKQGREGERALLDRETLVLDSVLSIYQQACKE